MKQLSFFKSLKDEAREKSTLRTELIAGIGAFLSVAYIIVVNANILAATGMDKKSVIIATCLVCALGTVAAGLFARVPIIIAPGIGLNLFIAYTLVIDQNISWEIALGIVFISGAILIILSLLGAWDKIIRALPLPLLDAVSGGIGLYVALIGLKMMGLSSTTPNSLVTISQLPPETLISLGGLALIVALEVFNVRGSILIGIIAAYIAGIFFGCSAAPAGIAGLDFNLSKTLLKLDINGALKLGFTSSILTLIFINMLNSLETVNESATDGDIKISKGSLKSLLKIDAASTIFGSFLGTSNTTSLIESAKGIENGGKTGLTSVTAGFLFLALIPFYPFFNAVPDYSTAPALLIIGLFLMSRIKNIDYSNVEKGFPSFITLLMMPSTSSITIGLAFGFISYTLIKIIRGKFNDLNPVLVTVTIMLAVSLFLHS